MKSSEVRGDQQREAKTKGRRGGESDVLKGLASGVVGGLVASVLMNQFQKLLGRLIAGEEKSHGAIFATRLTAAWGGAHVAETRH